MDRMRAMDGRSNGLEGKLVGLDQKFTARIDDLKAKMDAEFRTVHSEIKRPDENID